LGRCKEENVEKTKHKSKKGGGKEDSFPFETVRKRNRKNIKGPAANKKGSNSTFNGGEDGKKVSLGRYKREDTDPPYLAEVVTTTIGILRNNERRKANLPTSREKEGLMCQQEQKTDWKEEWRAQRLVKRTITLSKGGGRCIQGRRTGRGRAEK